MTHGFEIVIADGADELHRSFLREQYGADLLAHTIATHVARFRGEIFAADQITISVTRKQRADLSEFPAAA